MIVSIDLQYSVWIEPMSFENWLEIGEAAEILRLHPSTLRRWADAGKISHSRTLSGRRRFERSVIELARTEMHQISPQNATDLIETRTRDFNRQHASDLSNWQQGWFTRLTEEQTLIFRYSGQRLLGLLMQYVSRNDTAENFLEEAKRIARDYGSIFFKVGLSVSQSAETFLYFRRSILESVQETAGLGGHNDQDGLRVFLRTSYFFDALLVATIESHAQMTHPQ
jgi:excisionase family DNA binding protein